MKTNIIILFIITALTTVTLAHAQPDDLTKYRQSAMMFMRWNMATIKGQVIKKPQTYNQKQVAMAARAIAAVANTNLNTLFKPETKNATGWKPTLIKPEFIDRPDVIKNHLAKFKHEANELSRVTDSGNLELIEPQFKKLFQACRGCHSDFRNKP